MTWQSFIQYFNLQFLVIYFTLFNFLYSSSLRTKWSNPLLITRRLQPLACFSLNVNTMGMPKARRGDCHIVIQKSINPHLDYFGLFQVLVMTKMHVIANKVKQSTLYKVSFFGLLQSFGKLPALAHSFVMTSFFLSLSTPNITNFANLSTTFFSYWTFKST